MGTTVGAAQNRHGSIVAPASFLVMCSSAHEAKTLYDSIAAAVAANEKAAAKVGGFSTDMDDEYDGWSFRMSDGARCGTSSGGGCATACRRAARRRAARRARPPPFPYLSRPHHITPGFASWGPARSTDRESSLAVHLVAPGQRALGRFLPALDEHPAVLD